MTDIKKGNETCVIFSKTPFMDHLFFMFEKKTNKMVKDFFQRISKLKLFK